MLTFHHFVGCLIGGSQVGVKHHKNCEDNGCYGQAHACPQQDDGSQSRVAPTLCLQHCTRLISDLMLTIWVLFEGESALQSAPHSADQVLMLHGKRCAA